MIKPSHHYIGRCRVCGAVQSSVYDMADLPRETAQALAEMAKAGMEIERVPLGSVEFDPLGCDCRSKVTYGLPLFEAA